MNETPLSLAEPCGNSVLLAQAVDLQRQGHLDQAAHLYRRILAESPGDFDATQLLGVIALQQGDFYAAQRLLRVALEMNPNDTAVMANLGTSHMRVGDYEVALHLFESAIRLQPESSMWNANLGTLLHNMGRHGEAIQSLRKAQGLDPTSYSISMLLGASLVGLGDAAEAVASFEAATRADPGNAEGWEQLALSLNSLGRHDQGRDNARKALALNPRSTVATDALSVALQASGNAQLEDGNFAEAAESYRQAVSLATPSPDLLAAYGTALIHNGLHDQAIEQFARALELDGARLDVRWAMTMARLKPIYDSEADSAASRADFARALADVESWYRQTDGVREPFNAVGFLQPFYIAYQPVNNRELLSRYGAMCVAWMSTLTLPGRAAAAAGAAVADPVTSGGARRGKKLRLGIVSSHIHQHSVWTAITRGWVHNIDPERFELHLFKLGAWSDQETQAAKARVACFDDRPKDLNGWAAAIVGHELDAIIYPELGMHALTLQLASLRLAPVQAAAWGHPETTGLPTIDLYLSADGLEPPGAAENYAEELVRLPNLGVYVEPLTPAAVNPGLGSLNLSGGDRLLLCPGAPFKYAPRYDEVWVQIAGRLRKKAFRWSGGARLVFFRSRSAAVDRLFEQRLRAAFEAGNVDFDAHVSIVPLLERARFFGLMRASAVMLDSIGFSGFNTALQAIECALPVLAFEGGFLRGRFASAIMQRLELPELVAGTAESFIEKALELAADAGLRKQLRTKIIQRRDVLFYDVAPVRALEQRLIEAVAKVRAAEPDHAEARYRQGNVLKDLNQPHQALASYRRAIELNPRHTAARCNYGVVLLALGNIADALVEFQQVIGIDPYDAIAYYNRGVAEHALGQSSAALISYSKAIELTPHYAEAYFSRGRLHEQCARWDEALLDYEQAGVLRPALVQTHVHRGDVLAQLKRWDEALESFDLAVSADPGHALAHLHRGNVLRELRRWDAAVESYDRVIALEPDHADAHFNRAVVFELLKRFDEALHGFERAITLRPDFVAARYNRALLLLQTGEFAAGFESYEWRWKNRGTGFDPAGYHGAAPLWSGRESLEGRRILVFSEQGLGDTLQFCRYLKMLAGLGAEVVFEVQPPLVGLLATVEGAALVIARREPAPPCDAKCALLSLPLAFGTTLDTIPSGRKYLHADAATLAAWQARLGPRTRPRIGLVWSGNPQYPNDHRRSIPLATLVDRLPRQFEYFCLQTDVRAADRATLDANPFIADPAADLAGTAALCECMDLVISCCTSIAHLAGALGRPLWLLLAYNADWRWLEDRDDSPWYPTARLYRQTVSGDWDGVITRVTADLRRTWTPPAAVAADRAKKL